ncbi:MAG: tyrosine-type recombinase/integrase [Alphaproteobacteria bacterium]|nr:tyrosine-type recombinase/integrase [Alphaproteobacteria bacterium]
MSKTLIEAQITTAKARSKLELGVHWRLLDAEAHLGYRKGKRSGVWIFRWRNHREDGKYRQSAIGIANDINDKPTDGALTFEQARKAAEEAVLRARTETAALATGPAPTVRSAIEFYIGERDSREKRRTGRDVQADVGSKLRRYVLGQAKRGSQTPTTAAPLAAIPLHALREQDLRAWREMLPDTLKHTTKHRLINDLKAALNTAWSRLSQSHKELNPTFPTIVKDGFKAERIDDDDNTSIARENQILTDDQISVILHSTRVVDEEQGYDGDLYRIVLCLAATGARHAQLRRMRVGDIQPNERRLIVPASFKGRGGNGGSIPIPVGDDVIEALLPSIIGRPADAPLFLRWRYQQEPGTGTWRKSTRGKLKKSELIRPWRAIREHCGMPNVIPYALRHSSIVRCLRAGLPIQHVAKLHNTSVKMIEQHYAKFIATALEDLARRAIVPLVRED